MIPQGRTDLGDGTGYEKADANLRAVTVTMAIILSSSVVVFLAVYGMYGYFEKAGDARDAEIPDIYALQAVPPKPHLLPSPFDETAAPETMRGLNPQVAPREAYDTTTDDQLPWDKMRQEYALEEAQAHSYSYDKKTGAVTMPIEEAIARASGESKNDFQGEPTGESRSNLPHYYGGIYTKSTDWESQEHKLTVESSGGLKTETK